MDGLVNLILEHRLYFGLTLIVIIGILFVTSESLRKQLKKGLVGLLLIAAIGLAYYLITGKDPATIPADINSFFNNPSTEAERDHTYYKDPVKRYGDELQ